eukprot:1315404-Prymnesium_polylepis.1
MHAELSAELSRLRLAGATSASASASLGVATLFEAWSAHDSAGGAESLEAIQRAVENDENPLELVGYDDWESWLEDVSSRERADAETVARSAVAVIRARGSITAPADAQHLSAESWSSLTGASIGADGYLRTAAGRGRAIFGSGYNGLLAAFSQASLKHSGSASILAHDPLWPVLREKLGVNTLSCRLYPDKVLMPDWSFAPTVSFTKCINALHAAAAHGAKLHI